MTQAPMDLVLSKLPDWKQNGRGKKARCPAHDDRTPSLSIMEGKDGCVLVHCHAGCTMDNVLDAIGLDVTDLFDRTKATTAAYPYWTASGELNRVKSRTGSKEFSQWTLSDSGTVAHSLNGASSIPYRLRELKAAIASGVWIYIVEGEKDADNLAGLGFCATTSPEGAGVHWKPSFAEHFKGATGLTVIADNDQPGISAARERAQLLTTVCNNVRLLENLPVAAKGDVSDLIADGWDAARLQTLFDTAAVVGNEATALPQTVDATSLLACEYVPPTFVVEHLIPERGIVLLSADTGAAKTSFMLHTAASMSLALPVAGRFGVSLSERPTLFVNGEMGADTLKRFLHANVAGLGVESLPAGRLVFQGAGGVADPFVARGNADSLRALVSHHRPRVVFLDTFRALFDADESKAIEVRPVFDMLRQLTNEFDCSIVVSHHVRKLSVVSNGARERVSGSRDLIAAVDVHLAAKSPSGAPMNALHLDKTRSPHDGIEAKAEWPIQARWIDGSPPQSTFAAGPPSSGEGASAVDAARQEVRDLLDADGPKTKTDMGAKNGTRRRAIEQMLLDGEIVQTGKSGRAFIYGLPEHAH